jgi:hypothetical protein
VLGKSASGRTNEGDENEEKLRWKMTRNGCKVDSGVSGEKNAEHAVSGDEQRCLDDERGQRRKRCRTFRKQPLSIYCAALRVTTKLISVPPLALRLQQWLHSSRNTLQGIGSKTTHSSTQHSRRPQRSRQTLTGNDQFDAHTATGG